MFNYLNIQINKMAVEKESIEQIYEVQFKGDLNYQNCHELTSTISTLLEKDIRRIVFNFNDLTRVDSAGIGLIIHHSQKFESNNFEFIIVQANNQIMSSFNNISLDKLVRIFNTTDEGIDYFINKAE